MQTIFTVLTGMIPLLIVLYDIFLKKKRILLYHNFATLFEQMDRILSYSAAPADELFHALAAEEVFSAECQMICDSLRNNATFRQAWMQAFGGNKDILILSDSEAAFVNGFCERFGKGNMDEQHLLCCKYRDFCKGEAEKRQALIAQNAKQNLSMSVLSGMLIIIILY